MRVVLASFVALVLGSCGAAAPRHVITPMTPEAELSFENGIDFIDDPALLEGSWLEDWQREVTQRSNLSDAVLIVRIRAIHENQDLDRNLSYRISVHVDTVRFGTGIEDDMVFVSRQNEAGYASVHENESRLLNQQFVAFVRWVEGEGGAAVPRWHLSPATDRVVRRVGVLLDQRRDSRPRSVTVRDGRDPSSTTDPDDEE